MAQMRLARHKQFGSFSEKSEYDQLSLFDEAEAYTDPQKLEPELTEVKAHYRKKAAESKERLPKDLPAETVEHKLLEEERICLECGEVLHRQNGTGNVGDHPGNGKDQKRRHLHIRLWEL